MKKLPAFPVYFYEFQSDTTLAEEMLKQVQDLPYTNNLNNKWHLNFYNEKLFNWFEKCLAEVCESINLPKTLNLEITECWVNKTSKLSKHQFHFHPNCIMGAVYYLTSSNNDGATRWYNKHSLYNNWGSIFSTTNNGINPHDQFIIYPSAGKLVIFPAYLGHEVDLCKNNATRYTISFNTFFNGVISDETAQKLEIKTVSVRDKNKL